MGKTKIVRQEGPVVHETDYSREQYEGADGVKMMLFADNYMSADASCDAYVMPETVKTIFDHTGWGRRTRENRVEQGGYLLGRFFEDPRKGKKIVLVEAAVPALDAKGSCGFLDMPKSDMLRMHQERYRMNAERGADEQLLVVGWFHTHPNSLDVFMSGTDRNTQQKEYAGPYDLAFVLNPHRKLWKCYRSAACLDVKARMLLDAAVVDSYGRQRLLNDQTNFGG